MQNLLSMQEWFIIASQKYAQHAKQGKHGNAAEAFAWRFSKHLRVVYVEYFPKTIYDFSWEEKSNRIIFYPMIGMQMHFDRFQDYKTCDRGKSIFKNYCQ